MTLRERGDAHPLLDQRENGAYYIGDTAALLAEVRTQRTVRIYRFLGEVNVEFRELDGTSVAEWGKAATLEDALRYALGAFVD